MSKPTITRGVTFTSYDCPGLMCLEVRVEDGVITYNSGKIPDELSEAQAWHFGHVLLAAADELRANACDHLPAESRSSGSRS